MSGRTLIIPVILLPFGLGFLSVGFEEVQFATGAGDKALAALGTLFIVAIFVERAQQVYLTAWRGMDKAKQKAEIEQLEQLVQSGENSADTDEESLQLDKARLQSAKEVRLEYRQDTERIAFLGGLTLGILISFVGPRILSEVIVFHGDLGSWQAPIFHGVDILITGGLLGGGSQGIHKIIALITDFVDVTRAKVKQKQQP